MSGNYHNLTKEVTTSSNAPTVTKNMSYATQNQTVSGWTYYTVHNLTHSEVVDASGHTWQCQDTAYDEGASTRPGAGWPTTQTSYSTCGTASTAIKNYAGYDANGNSVAAVDGVEAANAAVLGGQGCTLTSAPTIFPTSSWSGTHYTSCFAYSASSALPTDTWNALSQHTQTSYDATQGLLLNSKTDVNNQVTSLSYSYDASGNATIATKLPGETGSSTKQATSKSACTDSSTLPCFEEDSNVALYPNAVTRIFYDSLGRKVETVSPGPDATHTTVSFITYNDAAHSVFTSVPFVVTSRTTWLDPNGAVDDTGAVVGGTAVLLDASGRTLSSTDPLSHVMSTSYSVGSSGVSGDSNTYATSTVVDANMHVTITFADAVGRTIYMVVDSGLNGGTLTVVKRTKTQYSVLDKPLSVVVTDLAPQAGQTMTTVTTSATYDDLGRILTLIDPDRGMHTYTYDADNQLLGDTAGSGANLRPVGSKYDLLGRLGCTQNSVPTVTDVDIHGACSSGATPYLQNTYDANPSGVTWTNYPVGKLTQSLTTTTYPAPDNTTGTVTKTMQYDQRGQLITNQMHLAVSGGSLAFPTLPVYQEAIGYNNAGQQTTTQTTVGGAAGYTFTQVYDSTTGVQSGLSNTSVATTNLAATSYNAQALLSTLTLKDSTGTNLATENLAYDGALRPVSAITNWSSGGSTIYSDAISYDNASNVIIRMSSFAAVPGVSGSGGNETQNFCYNEQNQMVWASNAVAASPVTGQTCGAALLQGTVGGGYTNSYVYTNLGQLWKGPLTGSGAQEQYLYCTSSQPHQLTALSPVSGSPTCAAPGTKAYSASYDAYGNVTSRTYPSTTTGTAVYDAMDKMVRWSGTTATNAQGEWYLYDEAGNRVLRRSASTASGNNPATSAATITVYAFGLEDHVYSYTGSGSSATSTGNTYYYRLNGRIIGTLSGISTLSTSFLLVDLLGSVVSTISNTAGSAVVQGNQAYGPYGNQRYSAGSMGTTKGYTAQYADDLTGLDYYAARYYDPVVGQFLSADTVEGNIQGYDPYAYVSGGPETKSDPTGREGCDATCIATASGIAGNLGLGGIEFGPWDLVLMGVAFIGTAATYAVMHQQSTNYADGCGCSTSMATVENLMANDIASQGAAYGNALPHTMAPSTLDNILGGLQQEQDYQRQKLISNYATFGAGFASGLSNTQQKKADPKNATVGIGLLYVAFLDGKPYMMKPYTEIGYSGAQSGIDHAEDLIMKDAIRDVGSLDPNRIGSVHLVMYTSSATCDMCVDNAIEGAYMDRLYAASGRSPTFLYSWTGNDPMPYMDERGG